MDSTTMMVSRAYNSNTTSITIVPTTHKDLFLSQIHLSSGLILIECLGDCTMLRAPFSARIEPRPPHVKQVPWPSELSPLSPEFFLQEIG